MTDFAKLVLDADTRGLKDAERDLKGVSQAATRTARDIGSSMAKLGVGLTAGVSAPLAFFGKSAFQAAMDAQEMESAFDVVFGSMSDDVRKWAETTGDAMGRSTQEIQRGALAFQELFGKALDPQKAADMSKEFAVLTQDLASFKNLSNEVAQQKLFSGLSGEAEPLRAVGVFINDAAVQAKALELGLESVNGAFTDQQKIIARAALIQEQLSDAQGDVMRTSDSTANQIRRAQAAFEELQITIGTKLLPVITPLIDKIAGAFEWFSQLPSPVQETALVVGAVAAAMGPLLIVIGSIVSAAPAIAGAFGIIKAAMLGLLANPVLLGAAAVVGGIYLAWQNWDKITGFVGNVADSVTAFWNEHIDPVFGWLIDGLKIVAGAWFDWHVKVVGYARDTGEGVGEWLGDRIGPVWDNLKAKLYEAGENFIRLHMTVFRAVADILRTVTDRAGEIVGTMVQMGIDVVRGLVRGIIQNGRAVYDALMRIVMDGVEGIKDFLGINSPSRLFMEMGGFMAEGMAIGLETGKDRIMSATVGLGDGFTVLEDQSKRTASAVNDNFKSMAEGVLSSINQLTSSIRGGGFLDILGSVVGLGLQLGGAGVFGSSIQANIAGARANGGPVSGGKTYLVGERGPELFTAGVSGHITANDNIGGGGMNVHITMDPSTGAIGAYVRNESGKIVAQAAPAIANGGAAIANQRAAFAQSRRV